MVGSIEVLGLLLALGLCFVADCVRVCVCDCDWVHFLGIVLSPLSPFLSFSLSIFWACVGRLRAECIYKYAAAFVARELLPCLLCPSNYALSSLDARLGVGAGGLRARGGTLGRSGDCIKINLTESICLIANWRAKPAQRERNNNNSNISQKKYQKNTTRKKQWKQKQKQARVSPVLGSFILTLISSYPFIYIAHCSPSPPVLSLPSLFPLLIMKPRARPRPRPAGLIQTLFNRKPKAKQKKQKQKAKFL